MDVIEIDAASHRGIDDAREIRERAIFMPASARFKVYIIDEAHQITSDAFNALLKLVEEPPPHLKFVFATTEPEKVLQTIRSRTHHYAFRLVPPAMLREFLAKVCVDEGAEVDPAVLPLVVRAGAGSVRDSLSVLDQLLAGAGPDGLTAAHAAALLGLSDASVLDDAVEALAAKAPAGAFSVVDHVMATGHDPRRFAMDLLERVRDLLLLQTVPDAPDRGPARRVRARPDRADALAGRPDGRRGAVPRRRAAAQRAGRDARHDQPAPDARAGAVARAAARARARIRWRCRSGSSGWSASSPRGGAAAEPAPARSATAAASSVRSRRQPRPPSPLARPRPSRPRRQATGSPAARAAERGLARAARPRGPRRCQAAAPAPAAQPASSGTQLAAAAGDVSLETVVPAWPDLLAAIAAGRAPGFRTAGALLAQGSPSRFAAPSWCWRSRPATRRNFQKSGTADTLLREALSDRFGGSWKITVVHKSASNGASTSRLTRRRAAARPAEPTDLEPESEVDLVDDGERARRQDPVAVAMEALGAQIVDERETQAEPHRHCRGPDVRCRYG